MSNLHTEEAFRTYRSEIERLYIVENKTLNQLRETMITQYGFKATKMQYETKFKAWRLQKNHKAFMWAAIDQLRRRRKREGKESQVYFSGQLIPKKKLQKELSRYRQHAGAEGCEPSLPENVLVRTPSPEPVASIICEVGSLIHSIFGSPDANSALPSYLTKYVDNLPVVDLLRKVNNLLSTYQYGLQNCVYCNPREPVYAFDVPNTWLHTELCGSQDFLFQNAPSSIQLPENLTDRLDHTSWFFQGDIQHHLNGTGRKSAAAILEFIAFLVYYISNNMSEHLEVIDVRWLMKIILDYKLLGALRILLETGGTAVKIFSRHLLREALSANKIDIAKVILSTKIIGTEDRLSSNIGKSLLFEQTIPLNIAIALGHLQLVKTLLEMGADINANLERDDFVDYAKHCVCGSALLTPWTPLGIACSIGHFDICSTLISHGANTNAQWHEDSQCPYSHVGETPLQLVTKSEIFRSGSIGSMGSFGHGATRASADIIRADIRPERLNIAKLLIENGALVNPECSTGALTPIQNAFALRDRQMVEFLIENGADAALQFYPKMNEVHTAAVISGAGSLGQDGGYDAIRRILPSVHDRIDKISILQIFVFEALYLENPDEIYQFALDNDGKIAIEGPLAVKTEESEDFITLPCRDIPPPSSSGISFFVPQIFYLRYAVNHCHAKVFQIFIDSPSCRPHFHGSFGVVDRAPQPIQKILLPYQDLNPDRDRLVDHRIGAFANPDCVPGQQISYDDKALSSASSTHPLYSQDLPLKKCSYSPEDIAVPKLLIVLGRRRRRYLDMQDSKAILEFLLAQPGGDAPGEISRAYTIRFVDAIQRVDYPLVKMLSEHAQGPRSYLVESERAVLLAAIRLAPYHRIRRGLCYPRSIFIELALERLARADEQTLSAEAKQALLNKALFQFDQLLPSDQFHLLSPPPVTDDPHSIENAIAFKLLLDAGADIKSLGSGDLLCRYLGSLAFAKNLSEGDAKVITEIEYLLQFGADVNAQIPVELCDGCSPEFEDYVNFGASEQGNRRYQSNIANRNCSCLYTRGKAYPSHQCNVIQFAVKSGSIILVDYLLRKGAWLNPHLISENEQRYIGTPLQVAIRGNDVPMIKFLLPLGADVNAPGCPGGTYWMTPLMLAVQNGNLEIMQLLLKNDAQINTQVFQESECDINQAARMKKEEVFDDFDAECKRYEAPNEISLVEFKPILQESQDWGNLDNESHEGIGSLDEGSGYAWSERLDLESIDSIEDFEVGSDYDRKTYSDALTIAIMSQRSSSDDMVRLLMNHGAKISQHTISKYPNSLRLLLRMGAPPTHILAAAVRSFEPNQADIIEELTSKNVPLVFDDNQEQLLVEAIQRRIPTDTIKKLIRAGVSIDAPPGKYSPYTPLQYAASIGRLDMVIILVASGAIVNGTPANTSLAIWNVNSKVLEPAIESPNALEIAVWNGKLDMTDFLLKTGHFIDNRRAAEIARKKGYEEIAVAVESYELSIDDGDSLFGPSVMDMS